MTAPLGVGLVGAGGFGAFCATAFAELPQVTVAAVTDTVRARAEAIAPAGARVYTTYSDLLADPGVAIVAINTPPALHAAMAIQAAEAGKHLFIEKPLATSLADGQAVLHAVERSGVCATVDYVLRFHPLHALAAQLVGSGVLGPLRHFALRNFATDEPLLPAHWFWDPAQSGGIHVEHGVHFIDLCNQLVSSAPDAVMGFEQRRPDGRIDRVSALVRYGDDALATFYHSFDQIRAVEQTSIDVDCAHGHIEIEGWIPTRLRLKALVTADGLALARELLGDHVTVVERHEGERAAFAHGGSTETFHASVTAEVSAPDRQGDYGRAIQAGMAALVAAIRGEQGLAVTLDDALHSLAVALAATRSAATGTSAAP